MYLTGAGLTNTCLGLPNLGFMDLSQVADHVMAIRCVIDLPLIVDIDTGFGNAVNVTHTIRVLEQAGASVIQIEDQHAPFRVGLRGINVCDPVLKSLRMHANLSSLSQKRLDFRAAWSVHAQGRPRLL